MARGLTIAVWIFCVNAMFTILHSIPPFTVMDYSLGDELINASQTGAGFSSEISFLGVPEIVNALNVFLDLILGPFTLAPQIMSMIGITGIVNGVLTGCLWLAYGWFVFQLVTGRTLGDVK